MLLQSAGLCLEREHCSDVSYNKLGLDKHLLTCGEAQREEFAEPSEVEEIAAFR